MIAWIILHPTASGLVAFWIYSNIVGGMPSPNGTGVTTTIWYRWLFGTLHGLAGGLPRILATLSNPAASAALAIFKQQQIDVVETQRKVEEKKTL